MHSENIVAKVDDVHSQVPDEEGAVSSSGYWPCEDDR